MPPRRPRLTRGSTFRPPQRDLTAAIPWNRPAHRRKHRHRGGEGDVIFSRG